MINALINQIKEEGQDFEFYPTTKEIVEVIYNDLADKSWNSRAKYSVLDIGCGNGGFFDKFAAIRAEVRAHNTSIGLGAYEETRDDALRARMRPKADIADKYGIEKSDILIQNLPDNVIIVGTDFFQNTLIDKKVDVIFSNPPYSQYEEWAQKIINEAYAKDIYLVIPERWADSSLIQDALKRRKFEAKILGSFDFLNAERAARAKVNIVKISKKAYRAEDDRYYREDTNNNDPFNTWFDDYFKIDHSEEDDSYTAREKQKEELRDTIKSEVVKGRNLVQVLEALYQAEMHELVESYRKIAEIDGALLKELGVAKDKIRDGLKQKIEGTKQKYWQELFDNLREITSRLTSTKRKQLLGTLHENVHVDFTESNALAIVIWVIKNANKYFDEQLTEMFMRLTEPEYIKNYKSNQKTWQKDGWRYNKEDHDHYTLDYRVITTDYKNHREESALVRDIHTIASNLGFDYIGDVKSFKNNNVHFKFEKGFMKAFNIEAARLLGWVRSAADVMTEFSSECEISVEDAAKMFNSNHSITGKPGQFLLEHR